MVMMMLPVVDPLLEPIPDFPVLLQQLNPAFLGYSEVSGSRETFTDDAGLWSEDLVPGATYRVTHHNIKRVFTVPADGGPYWVRDYLTNFSDPPQVPPFTINGEGPVNGDFEIPYVTAVLSGDPADPDIQLFFQGQEL